jgi:mono/diheme cytochrome c family protein
MIRFVFAFVFVAFALGSGTARAQPKVEKGAIKPTPASDAQKMFDSYCAVCHGTEGKGNGPAAASLKKAPADLTKIAERNAGTFPEVRVKRYIEGVDEVPAHGSRDMPIWGGLFSSLDRNTTQIRIQALSDYLKGMQTK